MPLEIDYSKTEKGMTLIEVMAALVLLSLLAVTILSVFTTSESWVRGAGKKTIAVQYANSIIDAIRANSKDLNNADPVYTDDNSDGQFAFTIGSSDIVIDAPIDTIIANSTINISPHLDSPYYPDADANGKPDVNLLFGDNLFDIKVTIEWEEAGHSRSFELSTIMGAQ
jgi:prepilin-type N-terminal cleavage/methylation domain-containing protein